MRRLASPGYKRNKLVGSILAPVPERIIDFKGLNRQHVISEGEMSDMLNLTSDNYPLLTPRKPRGTLELPEGAKRPVQLLSRYGKACMIALYEVEGEDDAVGFFFDGERIESIDDLSTSTRAVAINTKICFFPQKTYLQLERNESGDFIAGEYKSLEAESNLGNLAVTISTEDARITLPADPGNPGFKYDDGVVIKGSITYTPSGGTAKTSPIEVSCVIEDVVDKDTEGDKRTIVLPANTFIELTGAGATSGTFSAGTKMSRTMKDLSHIMEWNNRLWGCSNKDNTIYASKLGDPTNWQYFQGTSIDSYYAEQGTDQLFTGVAEYSGHIIFFKPDSMCRIYGTAPSNFQVTNTKCFGVEDGSRLSVVTINDTVFYKSSIGIMAYEGSIPYCISNNFNAEFRNVVAGTEGIKYYASCLMNKDGSAESELMVLDIDKGLWHKEDDERFFSCMTMDNRLYFGYNSGEMLFCGNDVYCDTYLMVGSEDVTGGVKIINPKKPDTTGSEAMMPWMAVFGPFDEYIEEHKIYSKLALRLIAKGPCTIDVYISIDEGEWEKVEHYDQVSTKGDYIPIIPRRCDRYSVKIEGVGQCEMKSLTRRVRQGSFGRL